MGGALEITWRRAEASDARLLWHWRNDLEARRASFVQERVTWREHQGWFSRMLAADDAAIWVASDIGGEDVGQVRLDAVGSGVAEVSIIVAPQARGQGAGITMLSALPDDFPRRRERAWIKPDNLPSVVVFLRAGFRFVRVGRRAETDAYVLERDTVVPTSGRS